MKMAFGRLASFAVAAFALVFVCEGAGKADMEWQPVVVASGGAGLSVPVGGKGEKRTIPANPSAARLSERSARRAIVGETVRGSGLSAYATIINGMGNAYIRVVLTLKNDGKSPVVVDDISFLRDWTPQGASDGTRSGNTDGSVAVFPSASLFVGVEHPMAKLTVENGAVTAHLPRGFALQPGEEWTFSYVVGRYRGDSPHRDFQAYLNAERAHPYRVLPHYNSWYDINIERNDKPWNERMNEAEALGVMKAFRSEMGKRGVFIQSYLWDDGWDEWDSLWDFHPGFPNGFTKLAAEAQRDKGASIGCWMSPCGGYGASLAKRVAYSRSKGYIGQGDNLLKLSNPTYYAAFRDRVLDMIKRYDMNIFKFDRMGNGSDADGCDVAYAPEIDAVVRLLGEMRRAKQDVFVNCTVGTWASPFWVMFADSIWRGGDDFAMLGTGSARQRWLTYRDNKIYDRFVRPCPLFPLNSMMMHGIIVGQFGPPRAMDRSASPKSTQDFADEVWMGVACGTGLQEYYITPGLMHPAWWDILADGVKWIKANEASLRDVHWVGGDPSADNGKGAIYGYASAGAGKGIVVLRNSSDETLDFAEPLWKVLDLTESQAKRQVKSSKIVYSHDAELGAVKSLQDTLAARLAPYGVVLVEFTLANPRSQPSSHKAHY